MVSSAPAEPIAPPIAGDLAPTSTPGSAPDPGPGLAPGEARDHALARDHSAGRRPALDGIRALAVTAVAIYHFGGGTTAWLPGGFLGVDVFFVLSGYLITGLLLAEYARHGRINLLGFWVRRLRRLAPALLLVLLAVCAWIWWATPPDGYPNRRADIFWTVGYLANWHLIATSETYFAAYNTASPLRHAWSLAVEEQFYLFWPGILFLLLWLGHRGLGRRRGGRRLPGRLGSSGRPGGLAGLGRLSRGRVLVAVATVIGIVLSASWMAVHYSVLYPSDAYYSTQGRVQELFAGVLLAVLIPRLRRSAGRWLSVLAGIGLVALLAAILLMPDDTGFYYRGGALGVCLVVALVVAGLELRPDSGLARVFSWRPAVGLGRISYGVYLWHWPLVVAIPITAGMSLSEHGVRQGLRVLITLAAATASFFLVEQPIMRSRRVLRSPGRVIAAAAAASALVIALAIPATALPGTLGDQLKHSSDRACPGERIDVLLTCTWPASANVAQRPVKLALLGDSTGRALAPGLDDWADRVNGTWLEAAWKRCTATGLMVLPGGAPPDIPAQTCTDQAPRLIRQALDRYRPPVVLVAEFWAHHQPLLVDGKQVKAGTAEHDAVLRSAYLSLVDQVAAYGGRVVFLELPPPGEQLGEKVATGRPAGHSRPPVSGNGRYVDGFNAVLRSVAAARPGVAATVSVTDVICPNGHCGPVQHGVLVRIDGVHYSIPFSRQLVPTLIQRIGLGAG
jgi:peptidoglycan/LPS O-acetylase OafA/YrhL